MAAPVLQFKRGLFSNLPALRAGEPGFTTDKYDLYVGIDSTTSNNQFVGSGRFWTIEGATSGSGVNLVEGTITVQVILHLHLQHLLLVSLLTISPELKVGQVVFLPTMEVETLVGAVVLLTQFSQVLLHLIHLL